MKVTYDPYADALYISHQKPTKSARSEVVGNDVVIDYDASDKILGMEILSASKQFTKKALKSINFEINLEKPQSLLKAN